MHTNVLALEHGTSSVLARYGVAILTVALAAFLTLLLQRLGYPVIFLLFLTAVLTSAWLGGFAPGIVAMALSVFASFFFLVPRPNLLHLTDPSAGRLLLYALISIFICWFGATHKRSEAARRGSEQHYRLLVERNLAGVFLSTIDGVMLDCNESFVKILGYDSRKEILSHPAWDFYFDRAQRESYIRQLQEAGSITALEARIRGKDNRPIWIILSANLIEDEARAPGLVYGTIIDITKRKQAEDALHEAERKYHDIFEYSAHGIFRTTHEGKFLAANPALAKMLGYDSPTDLVQDRSDLAHQMYVDPQRRDEFKRLLDERGMVRDFEFEVRRKDGGRIWISDSVRAVRDETGTLLYYEGTAEDITERKRAEEEQRKSEERYRELFENAYDAIYVHDLNGNYISINHAAEELSGFSRDEIIGRNFAEFVAPKQLKEIRARIRDKLSGQEQTAYEFELIAKDGHRVHVEVNSRLIFENGIPVGVQGTARDISARKRAEEVLRNFPRRLIGAQEAERRRVARELHDEIGQALTAIRINIQNLQQSVDDVPIASQLDGSLKIVDIALQQVRDLALDLRPSLLDDLGLVAALRWYLDREARRAGLKLDLSIDLHGTRLAPEIETACFRIVQETLTNIVRHALAKSVTVKLVLREADLRLVIHDDGIGFDVAAAQHRFAADASLGLQGMQERALAVGGRIEIESSKTTGTELRVKIPFLPIPPPNEED